MTLTIYFYFCKALFSMFQIASDPPPPKKKTCLIPLHN